MEQPRLRINRTFDRETAKRVLWLMSQMDEVPTFTVRRNEGGGAVIWFSQRTFDGLEHVLRDLKQKGAI